MEQIKLYTIKIGAVKTDRERSLANLKFNKELTLKNIKRQTRRIAMSNLGVTEWSEEVSKEYEVVKKRYAEYKALIERVKDMYSRALDEEILSYQGTRQLVATTKVNKDGKEYNSIFNNYNLIATSVCDLTRILGIESGTTTKDIIILDCEGADLKYVQQVLYRGLDIVNGETGEIENYQFFTASAGQIRQQKIVMIKTAIWNEYEETLMCGLTIEKINELGGMNINKFLAYLSLNGTSSTPIKKFDINRVCVVNDFEALVQDKVDNVYREDKTIETTTTYVNKKGTEVTRKMKKEVAEWTLEREFADIMIPHMDGAGICLPKFSSKNIQFRMPWCKGLLVPIDFIKYGQEVLGLYANEDYIIKDYWGDEVNLKNIDVIMTKSQFKLADYYSNWNEYKEAFVKYNRTFNIVNTDPDTFENKELNYQFLQTLSDMSDEQIEILTQGTKDKINDIHHDRDAQLRLLGATNSNKNRNYMQEALRLYPEMLTNAYFKKQVSNMVDSIKTKAKSGHIKIKNVKRTFICPDVTCFVEWLLTGNECPKGIGLGKDEVYCNLYTDSKRLALLRNPHSSREWFIGTNKRAEGKIKWFATNGVYVSDFTLASKYLTFDVDGDEAFLIGEDNAWLLDLAEEQMKDIRPLCYPMGKAGKLEINSQNIYESLKYAWHNGNIGKISNASTNIWSKDKVTKEDIKMTNLLSVANNFCIDSAKTLEMPRIPSEVKEVMRERLFPYFFQFAKGKSPEQCRPMGGCVMDRICRSIDSIPYTEFDYSKGFGKFQYKVLLNKKLTKEYNQELIDLYLTKEEEFRAYLKVIKSRQQAEDSDNTTNYKNIASDIVAKEIKEDIAKLGIDIKDAVDQILLYTFKKDDLKMSFLWDVFGDIIIENIVKNLKGQSLDKGYIMCPECGARIKKSNKAKACSKCKANLK